MDPQRLTARARAARALRAGRAAREQRGMRPAGGAPHMAPDTVERVERKRVGVGTCEARNQPNSSPSPHSHRSPRTTPLDAPTPRVRRLPIDLRRPPAVTRGSQMRYAAGRKRPRRSAKSRIGAVVWSQLTPCARGWGTAPVRGDKDSFQRSLSQPLGQLADTPPLTQWAMPWLGFLPCTGRASRYPLQRVHYPCGCTSRDASLTDISAPVHTVGGGTTASDPRNDPACK